MRRLLKGTAIALGAIIALLLILLVALPFVFDPNRYRGEIIQTVKEKTGRDLKIEGKLGWSVFPRLAIEAGKLELGPAAGFGREPFARIEAAGVKIAWLPLLTGRVSVDTFYMDGLTVNLARNAAGRANWDDLLEPRQKPGAGEKPKAPAEAPSAVPALAIGKLDIRRATLTWHDQASGARYAVRDLALATGKVALNEPFDLRMTFGLEHGTPARRIPLSLQTKLVVGTERLALNDLRFDVDDSHLTGLVEINNFQKPAYRIDLALDKIDLDKYLPARPAPKSIGAKPAAPSAAPVTIPLAPLRALNLQGRLRVQELKAFGVRTSQLQVQANARQGLVELGPNSAILYGGTYTGRTTLDARAATPRLKMEEKLERIALGPFLKDAGVFDRFSGTANLDLALTAQGSDVAALKRTLSGTAAVNATDGKIEGVNLLKLIADAKRLRDQARGKRVSVAAAPADETAFTRLRSTFRLSNGVATTDDLALEGPVLRATGKGRADLVKETLDFRLPVTVAEGAQQRGTTVPVLIGGTFTKPSFGVDLGVMAKQEVEKAVEKKLEQELKKLRKIR
jgi:AsmA protein